jgi:von Willebrand factor type A domain
MASFLGSMLKKMSSKKEDATEPEIKLSDDKKDNDIDFASIPIKGIETLRKEFQYKLASVKGIELECWPLWNEFYYDPNYEMPVLFQLKSGKLPDNVPRMNVELCIVLDRSGSMQQSMDDCKTAIGSLLSKLSNDDIVHIVTYDEYVEIPIKNTSVQEKDKIMSLVQSITPRGSTDLCRGVITGIKLLKENKNSRTKLLFLFSDGIANHGLVHGEQIGSEIKKQCDNMPIFISTFGLGNDYDFTLLNSIALCGQGNYFYIEHAEEIPYIVERGLNSMTRYWTQNIKLSHHSLSHMSVTPVDDLSACTKVREFALQQYLVKVKCSEKQNAKITFTISYDSFDGPKTQEVSCQWEWYPEGVIIDMMPPNSHVNCYMTILECAELNDKIKALMDNIDIESQLKIKELKKQIILKYQSVYKDDEYGIISMLLKKELDAYKEAQQTGMSSNATKCKTVHTISSLGHSAPIYKYANSSKGSTRKTDTDLGFTSFN